MSQVLNFCKLISYMQDKVRKKLVNYEPNRRIQKVVEHKRVTDKTFAPSAAC